MELITEWRVTREQIVTACLWEIRYKVRDSIGLVAIPVLKDYVVENSPLIGVDNYFPNRTVN
jgi:hypothetical protein